MKAIAIVLLLALLVSASADAGTIQCGLQPLPPLGCHSNGSFASCECDSYGCHWVWHCA